MRGQLSGGKNKLFATLKKHDFVQLFCFWKTGINIVWIRTRNWSRNRNQNFSEVGTATNQYGSTTRILYADIGILYIELQERPYKCNICGRSYSQSGKIFPISSVKKKFQMNILELSAELLSYFYILF